MGYYSRRQSLSFAQAASRAIAGLDGPGPFSLGAPGALAGMLAKVGFKDVQENLVEAPLRFASAAECVLWRRQASGTMQQMLRGLDGDAQAKIWQEVEEALRSYETRDGFESPCELLVCSGLA